MTKLYDIKNYSDLEAIPLYIKDDGTYVLEGPYTLVEVRFKSPGFKGHVLDQLALTMCVMELVNSYKIEY